MCGGEFYKALFFVKNWYTSITINNTLNAALDGMNVSRTETTNRETTVVGAKLNVC